MTVDAIGCQKQVAREIHEADAEYVLALKANQGTLHAKENDFLRQENNILRSKLGKRVPLTEADRRTLVRYGLSITC